MPAVPVAPSDSSILRRVLAPLLVVFALVAGPLAFAPAQAASATISGTVTTPGGVPIRSAEVQLYTYVEDYGWEWSEGTDTDSAGRYHISAEPGTYRVGFRKYEYQSQYWNNQDTLEEADDINLEADDVANVDAELIPFPTVTGKVTAADGGAGLRSIAVALTDIDDESGWDSFQTNTKSDGTFSLRAEPGSYTVKFRDGRQVYATSTLDVLEVTTAGVSGVNATLTKNPVITGQVTDVTNEGIEDVRVSVFDSEESGWEIADTETGPDGKYRLAVPSGNYKLKFSDGRFKTQFWNNQSTFAAASVIAHSSGGTTGKNAKLVSNHAIKGTVTGPTGQPVRTEVTAYTYDADDQEWRDVSSAKTKADGTYSIALPPGTYKVGFDGAGGLSAEYWNDKPNLSSATDIVLTDAADQTGKNAVLNAEPTVSGVVKGVGNAPVNEASVTLYREYSDDGETELEYSNDAETDSQGRYSFSVSPGKYTLKFTASGHTSQFWNNKATLATADTFTVASADVTGKNASLVAKASSISGTVTGPSGPVAEGLRVSVYSFVDDEFDPYWGYLDYTTTTATGAYTIKVDPGTYRLGFRDLDGNLADEYFDNAVTVDDATDIEVGPSQNIPGKNAQLESKPVLSGKVTGAGGANADGIDVAVYKWYEDGDEGGWWDETAWTETLSDGTYSLPVAQGTYRVGFYDYTGRLASEYYNNAPTRESADDVVVGPGGKAGINAQLAAASMVKGTVRGVGNAPIAGATVTAYVKEDFDEDYWYDTYSVETKADGTYALPLADGEYRIGFSAPDAGYADQFYDNAATVESAQTITVGGADVTGKDATLALGAGIKGTFATQNYGRVSFMRYVDEEEVYVLEDSVYTIGSYAAALPVGTYKVRFVEYDDDSDDELNRVYWNGSATFGGAQTVTVTSGSFASGINASFSRSTVVAPNTLPAIVGSPTVGKSLAASTGTWGPVPVSFTYQWLRGTTPINGAVKATYVPVPADVGSALSVRITGSKLDYVPVTKTSAPTSKVVAAPKPAKKSATVKVSAKGGKKKATLTITVKAPGVTPTGKVTIKLGSKTLKTVTLKNGKAVVTLKKQKKGKRAYTVIYAGDSKVLTKTTTSKKVKIR